jgi:hypothetical protein
VQAGQRNGLAGRWRRSRRFRSQLVRLVQFCRMAVLWYCRSNPPFHPWTASALPSMTACWLPRYAWLSLSPLFYTALSLPFSLSRPSPLSMPAPFFRWDALFIPCVGWSVTLSVSGFALLGHRTPHLYFVPFVASGVSHVQGKN